MDGVLEKDVVRNARAPRSREQNREPVGGEQQLVDVDTMSTPSRA